MKFSQPAPGEVHKVLLGHGRGAKLAPGEFRRSQVWIGGTRPGNAVFVPPPAGELAECLKRFELFLHDQPQPTSPLVKAALAHVQFETIHPFLDGNGRVGRLLIALQLAADGLLREPLLYLSLHFKEHRQTYYELLNAVRLSGEWETWLEFFTDAVVSSAKQAVASARRLLELATAASLAAATNLTPATVNKSLAHLERIGVVAELTRKQRGRVFSYARYAEILNEGMELPGGGRRP